MLNAPLCGNARGKGVFDKRHLRDSIGDLDEFRRATSSGDNHMHVCRTRAQRLDDRVEFHPAVDERVSHLIEDDKKNNAGYLDWAVRLSRPGSVIVVDNVIREGAILSPDPDEVVRSTRAALEIMGSHPRLDTAVLQTVGSKHWDGFALALVK